MHESRDGERIMLASASRLLFLYFFRDWDTRSIDIGFEFTTLTRLSGKRVVCRTVTINRRGVERHIFLVDESDRSIIDLPGRFVCYWVEGGQKEQIYQRTYMRSNRGTYVHVSQEARSKLVFDKHGIEKRAENLELAPRRYQEKFVRLLRF